MALRLCPVRAAMACTDAEEAIEKSEEVFDEVLINMHEKDSRQLQEELEKSVHQQRQENLINKETQKRNKAVNAYKALQ